MSRIGGSFVEKRAQASPTDTGQPMLFLHMYLLFSRDSGRNQAHTYNLMGTDHLVPRLMHGNADP
ncbi:hypothetical protein QF049_003924 [Paenibacillus sp. W4I10]|nr:hypothetical protein [Paenibacillus sp. W4I10]